MSWLSKLFGRHVEPKPMAAAPTRKILRPSGSGARPEAARIAGESILEWCSKLERESERTGNRQLKRQAENIRARFRA